MPLIRKPTEARLFCRHAEIGLLEYGCDNRVMQPQNPNQVGQKEQDQYQKRQCPKPMSTRLSRHVISHFLVAELGFSECSGHFFDLFLTDGNSKILKQPILAFYIIQCDLRPSVAATPLSIFCLELAPTRKHNDAVR